MNKYLLMLERIDPRTKRLFEKTYRSITITDELICYIESNGGETNIASEIALKVDNLLIPTTVYGGIVLSGAATIFASFTNRIAFEDSIFLIHPCIPPNGVERGEIFERYDSDLWDFISQKSSKISAKEIKIIAEKNLKISAKEALKIGLVTEIIPGSYRNYKKILKKEGLLF